MTDEQLNDAILLASIVVVVAAFIFNSPLTGGIGMMTGGVALLGGWRK